MDLPKVHFDIERSDLALTIIGLSEIAVAPSSESWETHERSVFEKIRRQASLEDLKDDEVFRAYRDLYWSHGMDPTKLRVSSEAVLRRILKGENLWRVSNLVDVVNLASAYHKIPIGLIDSSKIAGSLRVRLARQGELFTRIGGSTRKCRGRELVLSDNEKIICFGYATNDSELTKVTESTSEALVVLYELKEIPNVLLESPRDITKEMVEEWVPCSISFVQHYSS